MEALILGALRWELTVPSAVAFAGRLNGLDLESCGPSLSIAILSACDRACIRPAQGLK